MRANVFFSSWDAKSSSRKHCWMSRVYFQYFSFTSKIKRKSDAKKFSSIFTVLMLNDLKIHRSQAGWHVSIASRTSSNNEKSRQSKKITRVRSYGQRLWDLRFALEVGGDDFVFCGEFLCLFASNWIHVRFSSDVIRSECLRGQELATLWAHRRGIIYVIYTPVIYEKHSKGKAIKSAASTGRTNFLFRKKKRFN